MADRLEAIHQTLVEKTNALTTSDGWAEWLKTAARFRTYSLNNQLLIFAQKPDATRVAGYRVWQGMNRQVRKGEKSIAILAPSTRKIKEDNGDEKRIVTGFRAVSVFDISQTDGEPLPDAGDTTLLEGQAPEGLWDSLTAIVSDNGFTLERGDCMGANGYMAPATKTIRVRDDVSDAQATKTLIHEVAHMLLHTDADNLTAEAIAHRGVAEVEAESVAYLVAQASGMVTDEYSLPYVAGWSNGKTEVITKTANAVLKTARTILGEDK